jgi:hypothetical protein
VKRSNSLQLERLEDRTNPSSLTVSFVPDGTQVGAVTSELYKDYTGVAPAVWQQMLVGELQTALSSVANTNVTLTIVPDDGATMNAAAPQDGAIRIAAVNELFTSTGTAVMAPTGSDFMVAGGDTAAFGTGLGLVGPNGQPLSPTPTTSGQQSTGLLGLTLPVQKAYGNLYPTTSTGSTTTTSPTPTSPDGTTSPTP